MGILRGLSVSSTRPYVWRCPSKHTTPWIKPSHVGTHGDTCHSRKSHPRLDRVPKHATEIAVSSPPPRQPPPAPARKIRASSLTRGGQPPPRDLSSLPGVGQTWGAVGRKPWRSGWAVISLCLQLRLFRVILGEAPRLGRASSRAARSQPALFWVWRMPPSHRERVWLSDRTACRPAP